eukprot:TRINITY_DN5244_c0_g1_i1.p1 TRINITY_DN5244_c0_g1~~TRINITY_DN5244_c0_g1_i1.p1  ORF type:complete len:191 (-),score=31.89 TRINITY_DN5244_c0_g1_i1:69-599(-)
MALYGWALYNGVCIPRAISRGERLLQKSTHTMALALRLLDGITLRRDNDEAYRLLSTECDASDPHVQYLLGQCIFNGKGSFAEAARCFECAGNHVEAIYFNACAFRHGIGVLYDLARSFQLYRHAAEQGYAAAQYPLGWMYERGTGVTHDLEQAKRWMQVAADQGNEEAILWCQEH